MTNFYKYYNVPTIDSTAVEILENEKFNNECFCKIDCMYCNTKPHFISYENVFLWLHYDLSFFINEETIPFCQKHQTKYMKGDLLNKFNKKL